MEEFLMDREVHEHTEKLVGRNVKFQVDWDEGLILISGPKGSAGYYIKDILKPGSVRRKKDH